MYALTMIHTGFPFTVNADCHRPPDVATKSVLPVSDGRGVSRGREITSIPSLIFASMSVLLRRNRVFLNKLLECRQSESQAALAEMNAGNFFLGHPVIQTASR